MPSTTAQPLPEMANELWWEIIERLPTLRDRLLMAQVSRRFQALVCAQMRFLDLAQTASAAHLPDAPHRRRSGEDGRNSTSTKRLRGFSHGSGEGLDHFLHFVAHRCVNLRGLVLPPRLTAGLHVQRLGEMVAGLTALSLYGCAAVGDDDLLVLSRSSTLPASLELLLLCGTNITDVGLRHLAAFSRLKRVHACGTYATASGLQALASPAREVSLRHQERSMFLFPGMTEAMAQRRRGILYSPFSLFATSFIPSVQKNVRRLLETLQWLEKRQLMLERRILDKSVHAKRHVQLGDREGALAALRRKKMYLLQRERVTQARGQLNDSLLAFQAEHDLSLLLAPDGHPRKRQALDALQRIDRRCEEVAQAESAAAEDEGLEEESDQGLAVENEHDRLLREYHLLQLEVAAEVEICPALPRGQVPPTAQRAR